jgi:hypothetical protein
MMALLHYVFLAALMGTVAWLGYLGWVARDDE